MGATSPLPARGAARRLGVGRPHSGSSHTGVRLDRWAFVLEVVSEPRGRCVDTWRSCHDGRPETVYADVLRRGRVPRGLAGRVHALLDETATAAAARRWRECGAISPDAARAAYITVLRRRWGCAAALHGARLRLARAYLVGGDDGDAGSGAPTAGTGFDFGDAARMGAEFATRLGGAPAGQRGW